MMKKYFTILMISVFVVIGGMAKAQLVKQKAKVEEKKQSDRDWVNSSFEKDGVYGACVNDAYEFLKGKKAKVRPIVALVGTGVDLEHEALKANVWKNPKEKPDGKDNDKNGYVDDVNGWNFIGGKDGRVMSLVNREGEREFLRLKDKYGDILKDGDKYYTYTEGERKECAAPENMDEFNYFNTMVREESRLLQANGAVNSGYNSQYYMRLFDQEVRAAFPDKKKFSIMDIMEACRPKTSPDLTSRSVLLAALQMRAGMIKDSTWELNRNAFLAESYITDLKKKYDRALERYGVDGRQEIVGDNYLDINDNKYGNNVLLTADAKIGTMIAGVIAGQRGVEGRNNPIADKAEIMTLVVEAGGGEPYLKDMALAIRYAVDHGASVVVLPQQNSFYPESQKVWMSEAIRYAEEKGVLVIVPVHEMSRDLSESTFFPNRWMDGGKEFTNLMTVGMSDKNGMPSVNSNFGAKELDIYAPGMQVFSTCTGDTYQLGNGVPMASATVAGVAALIKTYYPKLTGSQIRNILLETVTSRKGVELEKNISRNGKNVVDMYLFEQLCLSGGIVNALEAIKAADKLNSK